jgi:hypothetical protein
MFYYIFTDLVSAAASTATGTAHMCAFSFFIFLFYIYTHIYIFMSAAASNATGTAHMRAFSFFIFLFYIYIYIYIFLNYFSVTVAASIVNPAHMCASYLLSFIFYFFYLLTAAAGNVTGLSDLGYLFNIFSLIFFSLVLDTAAAGNVTGLSDLGYLFNIFSLFFFMLVLDIKMHSPPTSPPRPQGSSRMTGGIFRGSALGNAPNAADFDDVADVLHPILGKVLVYSSNLDPANLSIRDIKPTAFIKHNITPTIEPVLMKVAEKYSPIRSKFLYINNLPT